MAKKTTANSKDNDGAGRKKKIPCPCGNGEMSWVKISNKMAYWHDCGRIADKDGRIK